MTTASPKLRSLREAARELGARREVIDALIWSLDIKAIPGGGAILIDEEGFSLLAKAFRQYKATVAARSA